VRNVTHTLMVWILMNDLVLPHTKRAPRGVALHYVVAHCIARRIAFTSCSKHRALKRRALANFPASHVRRVNGPPSATHWQIPRLRKGLGRDATAIHDERQSTAVGRLRPGRLRPCRSDRGSRNTAWPVRDPCPTSWVARLRVLVPFAV
jgi:hypothetical protein